MTGFELIAGALLFAGSIAAFVASLYVAASLGLLDHEVEHDVADLRALGTHCGLLSALLFAGGLVLLSTL